MQGGRCYVCGTQCVFKNFGHVPSKYNFTVDHMKPLARGGTNHPTNLIGLCSPCNAEKGARTMGEFLDWRIKGKPQSALPLPLPKTSMPRELTKPIILL